MKRKIHVYLIRHDTLPEDVYQTATARDALAFEDEFNRRDRESQRPTGVAADADVDGELRKLLKRQRRAKGGAR